LAARSILSLFMQMLYMLIETNPPLRGLVFPLIMVCIENLEILVKNLPLSLSDES